MDSLSYVSTSNNSNKKKQNDKSNSLTRLNSIFKSLEGRITNENIDQVPKTFLLSINRYKYFQKGLIYNKTLRNGSMKDLHNSIINKNLIYNQNFKMTKNMSYDHFKNNINRIQSYSSREYYDHNTGVKNQNLSSFNIYKVNNITNIRPPNYYHLFKNKSNINEFLKLSPSHRIDNFKYSFIYSGISGCKRNQVKNLKNLFNKKIGLNINPRNNNVIETRKLFHH